MVGIRVRFGMTFMMIGVRLSQFLLGMFFIFSGGYTLLFKAYVHGVPLQAIAWLASVYQLKVVFPLFGIIKVILGVLLLMNRWMTGVLVVVFLMVMGTGMFHHFLHPNGRWISVLLALLYGVLVVGHRPEWVKKRANPPL